MSKTRSRVATTIHARLEATLRQFHEPKKPDSLTCGTHFSSPLLVKSEHGPVFSGPSSARWRDCWPIEAMDHGHETYIHVDDSDEKYGLHDHVRLITPRRAVRLRHGGILPNHQKSGREAKSSSHCRSKQPLKQRRREAAVLEASAFAAAAAEAEFEASLAAS